MSPRAPRREEACSGGLGLGSQQACVSPWCLAIAVKGAVFGTESEEWGAAAARDATMEGEGMKGGTRKRTAAGIGGPFVSCQEKSVSNYLCLSPKEAIMETLWVGV